MGVSARDVTFVVDGITIAGHLRLPSTDGGPAPGVVFTGPFSGVKEQVTGLYAERLASAGFATLSFDHRGFGASGGRLHHEDPAGKLADLSAATSFLAAHDSVDGDRIGCVGICLGGGYALKHSAFDRRIRAAALVAGGYNDPRAMRAGMGDDAYRSMMRTMADVAQREHVTGEVDFLKAVSDVPGEEAVMGGDEPFAYYGTERSASPGWENRITRLSIRELLTFDAAIGADFIAPTPTLMVHGRTDAYCSPEQAQATFDRIDGPKEMMWLDTSNHIDLYDVPRYVDPAVDAVVRWFGQHL